MKKKFVSLHVLALALIGLAACSEQQEIDSAGGAGKPVLLSATTGDIALTRAADGLLDSFSGGEQVTVAMKDNTTGDVSTAVYTLGTPSTPSAGKSALAYTSGTQLVYPNNEVTLYAVYPSGSMDSHTVAHDQTGDGGYKQSDLLYARTTVATSAMGQVQNLAFSHQLAKLRITVANTSGLSITGLTLNNVQRKVTYTGMGTASLTLTPAAADDGDGNTIEFGPASASTDASQTYTCVFPAQDWSGDQFLTITTSTGTTATYTLTTSTTSSFVNGQVYALTVNLTPLSIGQTATLTGWPGTGGGTISTETTEKLTVAAITNQTYTGYALTPTITVTNSSGTTLTGTDYTVEYFNNVNAGTALVIVTGIGNYAGLTAVATFTINPEE